MKASTILWGSKVLRGSELVATNFKSSVTGKTPIKSNKKRSFGALWLVIAALVVFGVMFGAGNLLPSMISERLIETFDMQWADAVESKIIVFQQALRSASGIPKKLVDTFKNYNILIGRIDNGNFIEATDSSDGLVLKIGEKIIRPEDFVDEIHNDVGLYNAFDQATFSRAAYHFDKSAMEVMKEISSRNNYTSDSGLNEVMNKIMGSGSDITINGVSIVQSEKDGEERTDYQENGKTTSSKSSVWDFINGVVSSITSSDKNSATIEVASVLNVADTISKERESEEFYLGFMENYSKMKAGEGDESQIHEAMNYLLTNETVKIGETEFTGTALESPSLYAVSSGRGVDPEEIKDVASDRVLRVTEDKLGGVSSYNAITTNVVSTSKKAKGIVARLNSGSETGDSNIIGSTSTMISSSLIDNSFDNIKGAYAGEFLVEGAINLNKDLAKMSGGTPGDEEATMAYLDLNNKILALEAKADRLNRSPFDITSRNTFLGSIVYDFGITWGHSLPSVLSKSIAITNFASSSFASIFPSTRAEDTPGYLSVPGKYCKTYDTVGAMGTAQCASISIFDTSTLNDPFNDPEFVAFVEKNTTLDSSGQRTINSDSIIAKYIRNFLKRKTPFGVIDSGILSSLDSSSSSIPFISDAISMIKDLVGASRDAKRIASGEAFLNSKSNPDWAEYKLVQRYLSLARATDIMKQYADDGMAYSNLKLFEGRNNPVIAFLDNEGLLAEK